ncbi:hypothetical protein BKA01_004405 [Pseudonocardia eucalypti]|nr:hypothetical protein [Pseudonocardia eucalypti]
MSISGQRAVTAVLGLSAAFVGLWAQFAPMSFYESFPLPGRHWVSGIGAYNEHLIRDVGGLYLALLTISAWAVLRPRRETFRLAGAAWFVFSLPHLVFHLFHLQGLPAIDQVGNVVALGGTLVLAFLLLLVDHSATRAGSSAPPKV